MKDFDSNRIYQTLGDEFKNIYIVDCEDQQIHTFKETLKLPGFSSCTSYNDAMNQYIDDRVYEKNRDMLRMALSFNSLFSGLEKTERFNIHYQSKNDSEVHFMYSHFGRVMEDGRLSQIIIGFANEDLDIRRNNIDMFNNALPSNVVKRKVLIVEDNEINREILKETLEDDYDVIEAVNGEEGLNILSQYYKDISLILLDVVMPVCDGFEFLSRQKSDSLLASVPVIVTTGNNSQEDELKCLGLGAVDFITKPYNARIVKSRIDSVIKLRESSMTLAAIEKDELTGLYTRQAFYHHARTFTHFMTEEKFNVVILDVADFKLINGTYGTKKGNEVLVYLSNAFRYYVKNGLLTRYEGNQLLGLFHSKVKMDVERINRNINKIAEEAPIPNIRIKVGIYEDIDTSLSIPLFESDGLVVHLDEYVFENVCQFQKERMENKLPMVPISVNLSRASIHFNDVVEHYVDIVNQKQIPFECVPIELTESATLYSEKILEITDQLVKAGFKLHMDDFGSGYSSLTSLNELNFSTIKLDKSLIDYIDQVRGKKIVQQAIDLGHGLDMKVVAEGVESKEQKDCLKEMHCDMIQGFYYSKPLKQEDFIEKLRA